MDEHEQEEFIVEKPKRRRVGRPKLNKNSKVVKYFVAKRLEGKSTAVAVREAGISDVRNAPKYEKLPSFKKLEEKYADVLQHQMGMHDVAAEHIKNIKQDQDRGAKNKAIEMFLKYVQPEAKPEGDDDRMIVVLRT